jgi:hypothetical protein
LILGKWECYEKERMIINERKNWNQKRFSQVGCPNWSQNIKFYCFTAMWVGECPTQQLFEAIWKPIFPKFSFIIILLISQSFFLPALSLPQNEYQSFWKKSILFLIFHKF